ncbi:MAG: AAA family ATPase [Myxococcales bacterium]|nr:AAA family ATPase [Myxococcales bacterium]
MPTPWREMFQRFDPEGASDQFAWFVRREKSPIDDIERDLEDELYPLGVHALLTGTVGTGKTTELLELARRRSEKNFVVFVDLVAHFNRVVEDDDALLRVAPWEVCFLAGLQVLRAAEQVLDFVPEAAGYAALAEAWNAAATATKTEGANQGAIDLAKLAKGLVITASAVANPVAGSAVAGGLKLLESVSDASKAERRWNFPWARSQVTRSDQTEELKSMLYLVNQIVAEVARRHRPVLLVIDGLDRITSVAQAKQLFVESTLLSRLSCNVVLAGPFALRHRPELTQVRGFRTHVLVNEPVLSKSNPLEHGPGTRFFVDLYRERVRDVHAEHAITEAQLRRLAYYSGGRAREFVALVRLVARQGVTNKLDQATDAMIDSALDERRRFRERGLNEKHVALLEQVAKSEQKLLPDDPETWTLIDTERLLPYPNDSEWFYPHPLLQKLLGLRQQLE